MIYCLARKVPMLPLALNSPLCPPTLLLHSICLLGAPSLPDTLRKRLPRVLTRLHLLLLLMILHSPRPLNQPPMVLHPTLEAPLATIRISRDLRLVPSTVPLAKSLALAQVLSTTITSLRAPHLASNLPHSVHMGNTISPLSSFIFHLP